MNIQMPESAISKALNGVFLVAAAGGTYFIVNKLMQDAKRNAALKEYGNPNSVNGMAATFATQFYNAMYSTWEWWNDMMGDGTDEDIIYRTAGEMYRTRITLHDVAQKYKALYNKDLLQDLQRELDAEELQAFNRMLSSGLAGAASLAAVPHRMATAIRATILNERLQPVHQVPANTILGDYVPDQIAAYQLADGRTMVGFMFNRNMRYVDSAVIKLVA